MKSEFSMQDALPSRCQEPSRARAGAGWSRLTAATAVRTKAPTGFAKGQDGTLGV